MSLFRRLARSRGAKANAKSPPPAPAKKSAWEWPSLAIFWWLLIVVVGIYYAFQDRSERNIHMSAAQENASLACLGQYIVQPGDTLPLIAQKTGVNEADLTHFNPTTLIMLSAGTELCLPNPAAIPTPIPTFDFAQYYQPVPAFDASGQAVVILPGTGFGPSERLYLPVYYLP